MMVISRAGRSPLGVYHRSPLGIRSRRKGIHTLLMVFCSSQREENGGNTYPVFSNVYDGTFGTDLTALETQMATHKATRVCLIGVKRSGAYNDVSSENYATGLDMCYPDEWSASDYDLPEWLHTEEWDCGGDPGKAPANSLTHYDLEEWFYNCVEKWGMPLQVGVEMMNDTGTYIDGEIASPLSPWACIANANLSGPLPPIPGPGQEDQYNTIIQQLGNEASFEACEEFYDYLENSEIGKDTIGRFAGYATKVLPTPTGFYVDRQLGWSWPGWAANAILFNVPIIL